MVNHMKSMPMRGQRTATNKAKKANPFGKGESMKMEAAEKKMAGSKKAYAAMEKKYEPGMHKGKKK
jgi:hypothetical protein